MVNTMASTLLILLVRVYQWTLRPFIGQHCRFEPSCSRYAIEALRRPGAGGGTARAAWGGGRCTPWTAGGDDPVPDTHPGTCPCRSKAAT